MRNGRGKVWNCGSMARVSWSREEPAPWRERPLLGLPLVPVGSFGGLPWGESRECGLRRGRQELRLYLERAVYFRAEPLPRGLKQHDALTFRRALVKIQRRQA